MSAKTALMLLAVLPLGGCAFSGLTGAEKDFQCKAPDGVLCTSVSGVYANSMEGNLPAQKAEKPVAALPFGKKPTGDEGMVGVANRSFSPKALDAPNSGDPLRIPPLVLRVWVSPWEDADGDLNDQHYFYTVVHSGRWMIETNRESIRNQFKPVFPLKRQKPGADDQSSAAEAVAADGMAQGLNSMGAPAK